MQLWVGAGSDNGGIGGDAAGVGGDDVGGGGIVGAFLT